jgi:hypothetical protein
MIIHWKVLEEHFQFLKELSQSDDYKVRYEQKGGQGGTSDTYCNV